jgi:hypothetical protein
MLPMNMKARESPGSGIGTWVLPSMSIPAADPAVGEHGVDRARANPKIPSSRRHRSTPANSPSAR